MELHALLGIEPGRIGVVVAHPDDESFGLGGVLAELADEGSTLHVLCLTQGEASTLADGPRLGAIRAEELESAAASLGVEAVTLLDMEDGQLCHCTDDEMDAEITRWLPEGVIALVVFESGGVTGHPDHRAASASAFRVADALRIPVLEWGLDPVSAQRLRKELGLPFKWIPDGAGVIDIRVGRDVQLRAIRCHRSQLDEDPVVLRRLAVQGERERIRVRRPQGAVVP